MFEQGEGWSGRSTGMNDRVSERVNAEIDGGRLDLLRQQREEMRQLRGGRQDEATAAFGNLVLVDEAGSAGVARVGGQPGTDRSVGPDRADTSESNSKGPGDRSNHPADHREERSHLAGHHRRGDEAGEYQNLQTLAGSRMTDQHEREQFLADMNSFRERARTQGLSSDEVARTYHQVGRLLHAGDTQHRTGTDPVTIAQQVMEQAADPTSINQDFHNTCNVTTIESRTYTRNPSAAARLVADVALNGSYTTADHTVVRITPNMLQGVDERTHERGEATRSYASEIFQVTAVNIRFATEGMTMGDQHIANRGQLRYRQAADHMESGDNGERLEYAHSHRGAEVLNPRTHQPVRHPSLSEGDMLQVSNQITALHEQHIILAGTERQQHIGNESDTPVASPEELRNTLVRLQREGRLPVIVSVHLGNEPFYRDSGSELSGDGGGWHVVTATHIDEQSGLVSVDNQFGREADHIGSAGISVEDLYLTMRRPGSPENIAILQRHVDADRDHRTLDSYRELELLRQRRVAGMQNADYERELEQTIERSYDRWHQRGEWSTIPVDQNERSRGRAHMVALLYDLNRNLSSAQRTDSLSGGILSRLSPEDRNEILSDLHEYSGGK